MLTVFSTTDKLSALSKLGSVVAHYPEVPLTFVGSIEELFKALPSSKAVLSLGTQALESLQAASLLPKNRKVTGLRKTIMPVQGVPLMVSYSPTIGEIDYGQFVDLLTDTAAALRLAKTGSLEPKYGDYAYIKDFKPVVEAVKGIITEHGRCDLAMDTETLGLDRFHPDGYLISIQFTWRVGQGVMVAFSSKAESMAFLHDIENQKDLHWLLNCQEISLCGANAKYDTEWIYEQTGITCTNLKFDTTLVGSLLDENRSNGLDVHAKIYAPELGGYSDQFDAKANKARMDLEYAKDSEAFLRYSCGDTDATFRVREAQRKLLLQDHSLAGFYVNILHPAARAYELVERGGVCVDKAEFDQLEADLIADLHRLTNDAKKILGGILVAKHYDSDKIGGLNLTKASLINDFMFSPQGLNLKPKMLTEKTKAPVTSMEHLQMFKDVEEAKAFVSLMSEFSATNKTLSTYIVGFRQHIRSDGRLHPSYWLHRGGKDAGEGGTTTGRLSCTDPAFQCCVAETQVVTSLGEVPILDIVRGVEVGEAFLVLTHTGQWRPVIGVYRNGVRPVFKVTLRSGKSITCTGNHPLLTPNGWVKTEDLTSFHHGIICSKELEAYYGIQGRVGIPGLPNIGERDSPVPYQVQKQVPPREGRDFECVRVSGACADKGGAGEEADVRTQAGGPSIPPASAVGADRGAPFGWGSAKQPLEQLGLGDSEGELPGYGVAWPDYCGDEEHPCKIRGEPSAGNLRVLEDRLKKGGRYEVWCERGYGITDRERKALGFEVDAIVSIEPAGECETFDLTIEGSHSFVANGVVVHNTIPKHTKWGKRIRRCYNAPPGMLVAENDYSQGELKVMACLANEEAMIHAYRNGLDLHVVTSAFVAGYTYEEMMELKKADKGKYDDIRQLGKAGNFGLIYGMGVEGFIDYARVGYGVTLSYEQAENFRTGFFQRYPGLPIYHDVYKSYAHRHGVVRSPLGRVRHLPLINSKRGDVRSKEERRAINAPVQSTLSDMMMWAIAEQAAMGWHEVTPCFGSIHDACYLYIPEDNAEFYARRSVQVMENLPFHKVGWKPQLKFTADAKVGPNMADLKELKF